MLKIGDKTVKEIIINNKTVTQIYNFTNLVYQNSNGDEKDEEGLPPIEYVTDKQLCGKFLDSSTPDDWWYYYDKQKVSIADAVDPVTKEFQVDIGKSIKQISGLFGSEDKYSYDGANTAIEYIYHLDYGTSVQSLNDMFRGCVNLKSVTIGAENAFAHVQYRSRMFDMCTSLRRIAYVYAPETNDSAIKTSTVSYDDCTSLTTIKVLNGELSVGINCDFHWSPLNYTSAMLYIRGVDPNKTNELIFSKYTYDLLKPEDIKIATDKGWVVKWQ